METSDLITLGEAARLAGVTYAAVRAWYDAGKLTKHTRRAGLRSVRVVSKTELLELLSKAEKG